MKRVDLQIFFLTKIADLEVQKESVTSEYLDPVNVLESLLMNSFLALLCCSA